MKASIRTIIVDDEAHCVEILAYELRAFPEIEVVKTCSDGREAVQAIQEHNPDLVFLDIDMPYVNGFEVIRSLKEIDFDVIFVTAFDQFALKAFRYSALDYLLKPVDEEELQEAISKVKQKNKSKIEQKQVELLLTSLSDPKPAFSKLILPTQEGLEFVHLDDIIRCQADSNYTHVYLEDGRHLLMAKTLKDVERLLEDGRFFRTHQSHLIHLDKIKRYARGEGGYIVMKDDSIAHVARGKKEKLLARFGN